jgi:putative membrane protein
MMFTRILAQFSRGFAMGASDVVPGVSGGTVALILGIYNDLITNIGVGSKALGLLLKGDVNGFLDRLRSVDWFFLVPLLLGIGAAVVILAGVIKSALQDYPEAMAGLFFGLVIGSIFVARNLLQSPEAVHALAALGVGVVTFVLLGFQSGPITDPGPLLLVVAGALAICAMILPGISGSFILLMIGMYATVLDAVDERNFAQIALLGIGAIVGLGLFSSALNHVLAKHHDMVMSVLIGLMLGSLRVLWPWPNGVGIIDHDATISGTGLDLPNGAPWVSAVLLGVAAAVAVVGLSTFAQPRATSVARS